MWGRVIALGVLAVCFQHLFIIIRTLGFHVYIYNHKPGECHIIQGITNGSEDIELLSDGQALISSGYLTLKERTEQSQPGHIYSFDFLGPSRKVTELKITGNYDPNHLYPHGISSYEDKESGEVHLFVVNHLLTRDVVDIFLFKKKTRTLAFRRRVEDVSMKSMNDVVAVGPNEFYFTNDGRSLNPAIRTLEQFLRIRTGGVFFCDVTSCRDVNEALFEPNGIQLSRDGRHLFVSQPFERAIQIYRRESDNSLENKKPIQTIHLGTAPDNIFVDDDGHLWTGSHPVGFKAAEHLEDRSKTCPSQVIRVRFRPSSEPYQEYELDEVYSEEGDMISMASTAVYYQNQLLIGTVRHRLLHCEVAVL
ncbi:serum paraoxonase/arylesterase 2-like [Diadema antillarum]|uniref:serum paraoxonase/arylesterase 2-like n=1 Tax=Diadema antillarum TaxID=105358 RepID=UPI003A8BB1BF